MNSKIQGFINTIKDKKVAVVGIAVSNTPLIEFLSRHGARVTAFDKQEAEAIADRIERLQPLNIEYRLGPGYLEGLKGFDWIFKTPVIRPDLPEFIAERERGAILTSEMELFIDLCPATVFGVTGSDGKTTTTTLIYEILRARGYNCHLGGNIGRPLLSDVGSMKATDMAIVELSSFQLLTMTKSVNVAVITNLSPNHLDVHTSYDEYTGAKKNIFIHQANDDFIVLNYDNEETRGFGCLAPGRLGYFSRADGPGLARLFDNDNKLFAAAYSYEGRIMYRSRSDLTGGEKNIHPVDTTHVINEDEILIPGPHNVENYLAATCAVRRYAGRDDIGAVARTFGGVEHRIEYFRTIGGARYFNDSIASSPNRTMACLNTFDQKIILIAGGQDKKLDYSPLGRYIAEKVKVLILCGETSRQIKRSLMNYCEMIGLPCTVPIYECESYEDAVSAAYNNAKANDVVVLSPASTSFDRFKNFEERGRVYKDLVNSLPAR